MKHHEISFFFFPHCGLGPNFISPDSRDQRNYSVTMGLATTNKRGEPIYFVHSTLLENSGKGLKDTEKLGMNKLPFSLLDNRRHG